MNGAEEKILGDYTRGIAGRFPEVGERTAHAIASMLVDYKNAIYSRAVKSADKALHLIEGSGLPPALSKSVLMIRNSAIRLAPMQKSMSSSYTWEGRAFGGIGSVEGLEESEYEILPEDEKYFIFPDLQTAKKDEDIDLCNALCLCYAVALRSAPLDRQALEEWVHSFVAGKIADIAENIEID